MRVLELAGIGPGPFCAMMLADQGATVLRIDRPGAASPRPERDLLNRGRQSAVLDLKHPRATDALLRLVDAADVLLEGFRPGVTERLGVGPEVCLRRNPRLVYARMTGWGQHGPMSVAAGHDIGYIARAGALHGLGRAGGPPQFPANLLGDFGGGGMLLAYGICAALVERARSGRGQVVDAAIVDGTASLLAMPLMFMAHGVWRDERGVNLLDGGVPWYDVYETADGKWMAVGALEPQFYAALLAGLCLTDVPARDDPQNWPELRALFSARFKDRTREEWAATFAGTDACVEPVLSMHEAAADPHLTARQTYVVRDGVTQPSPAPRFSRTRAGCPSRLPCLARTRPRRSPSGAWPTRRTWLPAAPPSRPSRGLAVATGWAYPAARMDVRLAQASGRAAEVDIGGRDRPGRPPRRRLVPPVQVRMRDDLVRRRRPPCRLIPRRVGVVDQGRVVAPDERAVERRADARVGLRADDDEPPDSQARQHGLQGGVLEGVAVVLLDQRLGVVRSQFGDDPPVVAPSGQLVVGVLDPDDRDPFPPRLLDQAADASHDRVALVSLRDDAVLHVDDEECGVRPVLECGHGLPLLTLGSCVHPR